ncbi:MAG: Penicillin-binding protein, partial [Candidatus Woesebacteria bacterium GW2011_GWA1_39_8]
MQEEAQKIVSEEINKVESLHITNGAAVVVDPQTGEVLAMVGSKNFNDPDYDGQVNVTTSLRQPGSSIKPFTYVTAFKKGYTPATLLMDVPTEFPGGEGQPAYNPVNYDGKYRGPMQVRYALANSINVAAVKMLAKVGIKEMMQTAYDLGIDSLEPTKENLSRFGLSLTLGGGEVRLLNLTEAYSAFMNQGYRVDPVAVLKVTDINGKVLEENHPDKGRRLLTPEQAYLIADILSDNQARSLIFGTNSLLNIPGRQVAV